MWLKTSGCIVYYFSGQQFTFNITHRTLKGFNLNSSLIHLHFQSHYLVWMTTGHLDPEAQLNTTKSFFNGFHWLCFSFQIKSIFLADSLCLTHSDQCTQTQGTRTRANKHTQSLGKHLSCPTSIWPIEKWIQYKQTWWGWGVSRNMAYAAFEIFLVRSGYSRK